MPGPYMLAWVEPEEAVFGPEHHRYDEQVESFELTHAEGDLPTVSLNIRNPQVGPLSAGRKTWIWLSYDLGGSDGVMPVFFGRLVGVPSDYLTDMVTFEFTAEPELFEEYKHELAEEKRALPRYDEVFVDLNKRDDPDTVLEGYSEMWHVDRVTHEVTTSAITEGEDGTEVFEASDVPYDSVSMDLSQAPLLHVSVDATVTWRQRHTGTVNFGGRAFGSYSGDGIVSDWPKVGTSLEAGWSVLSSLAIDNLGIANAITASWSYNYQNKAKQHANGDTMSISISASEPQLSSAKLEGILTLNIQTGVLDPYAVDENGDPAPINIPASISVTKMIVPLWSVTGAMVLRYDADRERTERLTFVMRSDIQDVLTAPDDSEVGELITVSGVDVGNPILRLRSWLAIRETAVALGELIFPDYPGFPGLRVGQVAVQAGVTGEDHPDFSHIVGDTTNDGGVIWASLGTVSPTATPPNWTKEDIVPAGTVILPSVGLVVKYGDLTMPGMVSFPPTGVAISEGQMVRANDGSYHVCKLSGTTAGAGLGVGSTFGTGGPLASPMIPLPLVPPQPPWAATWGIETTDGSVVWFCLGTELPDGAHYQICTQAGTTGEFMPPFSNTPGDVTTDGTAQWTNMGVGEIPVGGVPGNTPRSNYFPTDRGLQSLEYLLHRARARLLYRARAVRVKFKCRIERALHLSCRKNALITAPSRLATLGGQAFGKIVEYKIVASGSGAAYGEVTIGCTVGRGNSVTVSPGNPCYVSGYVTGYQRYDGAVVTPSGAGDVAYAPPVPGVTDDGMVFPLTKEQVIITDRVHGSLLAQEAAIDKALKAARKAAELGQINAQSAQQSVALQRSAAVLNMQSVEKGLQQNPIWYELSIRPVTNGPFDVLYSVGLEPLVTPRHVDLEAA